MTRFTAVVDVAAHPHEVWAVMTDWPSHGRWIPLTRVRVLTAHADGVGARFVGRTSLAAVGLDRLGFDDPMEVTGWQPPTDDRPGRCTVRKLGRVVRGSAAFHVVAVGGPGVALSRVVWEEDLDLAPRALTRLVAPLVALAGRLAFTSTLRAMGREVTGGSRRR